MRWAWMLGWLLGQMLVGLLLAPLPARACRCVARYQSFVEEATAARLVFSGRVVAHQEVGAGQLGRLRFELRPGTVWKGPTVARYVIYSDQSSCGVDFRPGQDYLFIIHDYPGLRPDSLYLGRCGGYHAPLAEARVLGLVKALFVPTLRANLGAASPRLNASEAEYLRARCRVRASISLTSRSAFS